MPGDTPPTPDQVREALNWWQTALYMELTVSEEDRVRALATAARDWLRIQEEAETIWWCEEHDSVWTDGMCQSADLHTVKNPTGIWIGANCRMVEADLVKRAQHV